MYCLLRFFFFFLGRLVYVCWLFFSSRRRHTIWTGDWSSDVCSSDLPVKASISAIESQGFAQDKSGPVSVSGKIDWYIYADSGGVPKGNPEDHKNDYVWHYSANAGASGVGTTNGVITLDLGAAGQPDVALTGGSYWLITVPSFNSSIADSNDPSWYWLEGKSTNGTANGQAIDPSNTLGGGRICQEMKTSFALTLSGTFDC